MLLKILRNVAIWAWLLIGPLWYFSAYAAEQNYFDVYNLEVEGDIYNYVTADFNGDGLTDVAMIYSPYAEPNGRYIGLHMQKSSTGFSVKADYLVPLPVTAVQVDAGDIDADGQAEILVIDGDGVLFFKYSSTSGFSAPARLIRQNTIYAMPSFQGIIADKFLFDIVIGNGPEIIVPTTKGYTIFEKGSDGRFQILNQLTAPNICRSPLKGINDFSGRTQSVLNLSIPDIIVTDGNLDGRSDLYLLWDRKLCCYFQDSSGNFPTTPDIDVTFQLPGAEGYMQSRLIDLNGDRRPDITVSYTSGGITKAETKLRFFLADNRSRFRAVPDKEISLSDSHCNLMINDFNFDSQKEVVVPAVELGAIAATKMLLMKKASLHLLIYALKNGLPDDEPLQRSSLDFRINFDEPVPTREVTLDWSADFTGDNLLDLVYSDGSGRLQFFWGSTTDYFSKKSDVEIALDHPSEMHPVHLNKGRLSDLIVEYNLTGRIGRLTVLKNKNNKL